MIVFAVMAVAAATSVDSSDDNTRLLQGSCKSLLRRGKCRQRSDCVWQNGQCRRASGGGCRLITKKQQCNAKRNCEWHKQRCRRRVGGTTVSPPTTSTSGPITGGGVSSSVTAALASRLAGGVVDACLCSYVHKPCVKATVDALQDFLHGGNSCTCYQLKLVGGTPTMDITNEDNCVCDDSAVVLAPPMFRYGGENCECFVI